jgi:two-component system chemotaxis sensor kinase CheA
MNYDEMINLLDLLAQEYLFLDCKNIDIPTAGKLLNHLENIINEAQKTKTSALSGCARGMSGILEKIILDAVGDKTRAADLLEEGIGLMQKIADCIKNTGKYDGGIQEYMAKVAKITDVVFSEEETAISGGMEEKKATVEAEAVQIQDESLVRDFIAEGLEYIEEIEVNILNLEKEPENKDYINTIFRPFHSIKGVASFLNLEKIRSLAHSLENLLDKARNGELSVTPALIDVILDGSDTLKTLIGQLRDQLEGREIDDTNLDIPGLKARIGKIEQGFDMQVGVRKIGEILVDDGIISTEKLEQTLKLKETKPDRKLGQTLIEEGIAKPKQVSQALRKQVDQVADLTTIRVDTTKLDDLIDMVGEL